MIARKSRFVVGVKLMAVLWGSICVLVHAATAQDEAPIPKASSVANAGEISPGEKGMSVRVFPLRNVTGKTLPPILSSLAPDAIVAFDGTSNQIVAMASPSDQSRLEKLIKELDVLPLQEGEFKVFNLRRADAQSMLKVVSGIASSMEVTLAVDPRTNSLLAAGPRGDLAVIEALLMRLDEEESADTPLKTYRVRVVWFAEESSGGESVKQNEDLLAVQQELTKIGQEGLRPIGQTIVNTTGDGKFQVGCSAMLSDGAADLKIEGDLKVRLFVPHVSIRISAERGQAADGTAGGTAERAQLVSLSTEIVASVGHYVVLGITPVHERTLAFAVQVQLVD